VVGRDELAEAAFAMIEQNGVEIDAGRANDVRRAVRQPAVGVYENGPAAREIFD
jgi:hypothetical protein